MKRGKIIVIYHRYGKSELVKNKKFISPVLVSRNHLSEMYEVSYLGRIFKECEELSIACDYAEGFRDALLERLRA